MSLLIHRTRNYLSASLPQYKLLRLTLLLLLSSFHLGAETYLEWNDIIGRSFEAKIVGVSALEVRLENKEGIQIDFPIADLKPSSKEHVRAWQAAQNDAGKPIGISAAAQNEGPSSVFDELLLGDLVRLDGKELKRCTDATRPQKYYAFYYTASWCGPCQRYTPQLVEWYNKNKNENFELVLITSDGSEEAMEGYAAAKNMPWPQLEHSKAKNFKKSFQHGVRGIPSLIVCELDGKNLGNFRSRLDELSKLIK